MIICLCLTESLTLPGIPVRYSPVPGNRTWAKCVPWDKMAFLPALSDLQKEKFSGDRQQ